MLVGASFARLIVAGAVIVQHVAGAVQATAHTNTGVDTDYYAHAIEVMDRSLLVDGHVDLPFVLKSLGPRPLDVIRDYNESIPGHIDIKRMREGRLGAVFMVAWTPCPDSHLSTTPADYADTGEGVRDTLEAIDIIQEFGKTYPNDLALARTSQDMLDAKKNGKIAYLIGVEGGHQLGNSLSVVRLYAQMGVRYITLTHTCHNVFASSAGSGRPINPAYPHDGLTPFGEELVDEMNRLGIVIDLSHTSPQTMRDAIKRTRAPVMFSHSGARDVYNHPRNIPEDVLQMIGDGEGKVDGIVMAVFYTEFVDPASPTVERVADHIEHVANICGKKHVGIGSDFDGIEHSVRGLEDASKYPNLIVELIKRGWTDAELEDLMGNNLMRVLDGADRVKEELSDVPAASAVFSLRDVGFGPAVSWYLPRGVREFLATETGTKHDEL